MPNICYIKSIPTPNFGMEMLESSIKRLDRGNSFGWGTDFTEQPPSTWSNDVLGWELEWSLLPLRRSRLQPPKLFRKFNAKYCGIVHSKTTMASETWVKITDSL
jgi:hypothetical protein